METLISWDHSLFFAINGWYSPILDLIFTGLTYLGEGWSLVLCALFIFASPMTPHPLTLSGDISHPPPESSPAPHLNPPPQGGRKEGGEERKGRGRNILLIYRWRALILIFVSWLLSGILVQALKRAIDRPRPVVRLGEASVRVLLTKRHEHSFPSGHAQTGFSIAASLSLLYNRRRWLQTLLYALACGVGLSRIYVGAHFPSDVLAGALIGILISLLTYFLLTKYLKNDT